MSTQKNHKKSSSEPPTPSSTRPPSIVTSSRTTMTNRSSVTTGSRSSRTQNSSESATSSGQVSKRSVSLSNPLDGMPKPKYTHQEFSAWKQYMTDGANENEKPDENFINWKKMMLGEGTSEIAGKKAN